MMENTTAKKKYEIVQPLLLALMVVFGIVMGRKIEQSNIPENKSKLNTVLTKAGTINALDEVNRYMEARYVDSLNLTELTSKAIQSLIQQLDSFSSYIPNGPALTTPHTLEALYGLQVKHINGKTLASRVSASYPIWHTALSVGDEIISLNHKPAFSAANQLWAEDTTLLVHFKKNQGNTMDSVVLQVLDLTAQASVPIAFSPKSGIGYIKIKHFGETTYDEFITAVDTLFTKKACIDFIIDLRDNHGGYLEECSRILNQLFPDKNITLVTTIGRTVRKMEYKTDGRQVHSLGKIAVIINESSASASEVFAGAVQDLGRGLILGAPSYGKGLVQEQYMLSNGAALRLSVARFILPGGRLLHPDSTNKIVTIHGKKVKYGSKIYPDVEIDFNRNHIDQQTELLEDIIFQIYVMKRDPAFTKDPESVVGKIYESLIKKNKIKLAARDINWLKEKIRLLVNQSVKKSQGNEPNDLFSSPEMQQLLTQWGTSAPNKL